VVEDAGFTVDTDEVRSYTPPVPEAELYLIAQRDD
jgi:hypothetical protein